MGDTVASVGNIECRTCGRSLPATGQHFYRSRFHLSGYDPRCKQCQSKRSAVHNARPETKSRRNARRRERYKSEPGYRESNRATAAARHAANPARRLLASARDRAEKRGIPFSLSLADIIVPERCPLLGIEIVANVGTRGPAPNSPALDRIDPQRGYEPGNVWVVSYRANAIKNDASPDELEMIAAGIRRRLLLKKAG